MEYILFSPIGTTDPITNWHDGAMLHIVRNYRPVKVYLYFSKEMSDLHTNDNRYLYCLNELCKLEGMEIDTEIIQRFDLVDVQRFDDFYNDFENELNKIGDENEGKQILLNVSSGTPAMKAALYTIAALSDGKYVPIQVSTPERKSNPKRENIYKYEKELEWECNIDNERDGYINRCEAAQHINFIAKIKYEIIYRHLRSYDYNAALSIAKEISGFPISAMNLLQAACCRLQLDKSGVSKTLKGINIYPVKEGNKCSIFEFLLWLQIKYERKDLADFIRGITPVVMDLFEMVLKLKCGIDLKRDYCIRNDKTGAYKLVTEKLEKDETGIKILDCLNSVFKSGYKETILTSAQLAPLIMEFSKDDALIKTVSNIRKCEEAARNLAAHEIVSVTEEWIKRQCGISSGEIMKSLKTLCRESGIKADESAWNSYKTMNAIIENEMRKNSAYIHK